MSYSGLDQEWVQDCLVQNLEPGYKLCLHERDFDVGRSITENIVNFMSKSKSCLIILSENYLRSNWCNFEAQIAQTLMKQDAVTMILLENELATRSNLSISVKSLVKTRTFIIWDEKDAKFWRRVDEALTRNTFNTL